MSSLLVLLGVGEVAEGVGESVMEGLLQGQTILLRLQVVVLDVLEVEVVDLEAGGQNVVLVDVLDEGLHAGLADELLLAVGALDLGEVPGDAGDEQMGESVFLHRKGGTLLPSS